jgi:integrase
MSFSHDVQFWRLARLRRTTKRKRVYGVRWMVAGRAFSKWFEYEAQADNYRSKLMQAARKGEGFDIATGQPESAARQQQAVTWFDLACRFVDLKWPHVAAKSRTSIADALATVTPVMVITTRGMPEATTLRAVLYGWAFHKTRRETTTLGKREAAALCWVRDHSLPAAALDEPERRSSLIRRAPDACTLTMSGKPAAATTIARERAVFYSGVNYAVELDILPANPIRKVAWKAPEVAEEVDRRVVARPGEVRSLLAAVEQIAPELTAFFGCLYYGCMRPGEAVILRQADWVTLPGSGWGLLLLSGNAPRRLTVDGLRHPARQAPPQASVQEDHTAGPDPARTGRPAPRSHRTLRHNARRTTLPRRTRGHAQREQLWPPHLAASQQEGAHPGPG